MLKIDKCESGGVIPDGSLIIQVQPDERSGTDRSLYWMTPRDKNMTRDLRHIMRENQTQFWSRFGVTQTQGSRFERGRAIPLPVLLLIRLYLLGIISDTHLSQVDSANFGTDNPA